MPPVAGTSMGLMVQEANKLSGADRAVAEAMVQNLDALWIGYPIYLIAALHELRATRPSSGVEAVPVLT